jgi:hypothetical protein
VLKAAVTSKLGLVTHALVSFRNLDYSNEKCWHINSPPSVIKVRQLHCELLVIDNRVQIRTG